MATNVWRVLTEAERLPWSFTPFESVGPLEFGMTHNQVEAAVHGTLRVTVTHGTPGNEEWADFNLNQPTHGRLYGPAVTAFYDPSIGLAAIAVNALRGPHVTFDGPPLVGRTPSRLEDELTDYVRAHGEELRYSQSADPCAPHLGLVVRAQRAGDVVLSRPVMVAREWADGCWDNSNGSIPTREWKTFEW